VGKEGFLLSCGDMLVTEVPCWFGWSSFEYFRYFDRNFPYRYVFVVRAAIQQEGILLQRFSNVRLGSVDRKSGEADSEMEPPL